MIPLIVGGAAAGLLKSELVDKQKDARNRRMQAEIARYSPWSGMQADVSGLNKADPLGTAMQGGMAGAMLGQSMGGGEAAAAGEGSAGAVGATQSTAAPAGGGYMGGQYQNYMQSKYPWAF